MARKKKEEWMLMTRADAASLDAKAARLPKIREMMPPAAGLYMSKSDLRAIDRKFWERLPKGARPALLELYPGLRRSDQEPAPFNDGRPYVLDDATKRLVAQFSKQLVYMTSGTNRIDKSFHM